MCTGPAEEPVAHLHTGEDAISCCGTPDADAGTALEPGTDIAALSTKGTGECCEQTGCNRASCLAIIVYFCTDTVKHSQQT